MLSEINKVFKVQQNKGKKMTVLIAGCMVLLCGLVVSMTMLGEAMIPIPKILVIILDQIEGLFGLHMKPIDASIPLGLRAIVWDIRLPRILTGVFVGAGLAISGTIFQALLMNPLADPFTMGISTGAALGATIAIYMSAILQIASVAIVPSAFVGALITLMIVMKIAGSSQTLSASSLIVAGIIVSSIGSAAISLIKSLSGDEVSIIVFWLMGSLSSRTWQHVAIIVPVVVIGGYIGSRYGRELNILCTGEVNGTAYGIDVKKVRLILLIVASLITATCVSVSGIIGFVGLVIPHMLRQFITTDHKYLIPLSGCAGAILLMVADNLTRTLLKVDIPVGVLTTLIGGPFFLYLFTRKKGLKGGLSV
jgi:iron complex transport system permease protein